MVLQWLWDRGEWEPGFGPAEIEISVHNKGALQSIPGHRSRMLGPF